MARISFSKENRDRQVQRLEPKSKIKMGREIRLDTNNIFVSLIPSLRRGARRTLGGRTGDPTFVWSFWICNGNKSVGVSQAKWDTLQKKPDRYRKSSPNRNVQWRREAQP